MDDFIYFNHGGEYRCYRDGSNWQHKINGAWERALKSRSTINISGGFGPPFLKAKKIWERKRKMEKFLDK